MGRCEEVGKMDEWGELKGRKGRGNIGRRVDREIGEGEGERRICNKERKTVDERECEGKGENK